jgi:hypothetical protein
MHDRMAGYHDIRVDGPQRRHYRLCCKPDTPALGRGPLLTVLCGGSKPFRTEFPEAIYDHVLDLGHDHLSRNPRSLV